MKKKMSSSSVPKENHRTIYSPGSAKVTQVQNIPILSIMSGTFASKISAPPCIVWLKSESEIFTIPAQI